MKFCENSMIRQVNHNFSPIDVSLFTVFLFCIEYSSVESDLKVTSVFLLLYRTSILPVQSHLQYKQVSSSVVVVAMVTVPYCGVKSFYTVFLALCTSLWLNVFKSVVPTTHNLTTQSVCKQRTHMYHHKYLRFTYKPA